MNLFRTAFLPSALALSLAASSAVFAQTPPLPELPASAHGVHGAFNRALRSLNLTPAQQQQIAQLTQAYHQAHPRGSAHDPAAEKQLHVSIMNVLTPQQQAQFAEQLSAMRGAPGAPGMRPGPEMRAGGPMNGIALSDAQKTQIRALTQQYRTQILNVLTPEQRAQYQRNTSGMQPAGAQPGDRGGLRGANAGMMAGITLTADQQSKIRSLMTAFHAAHQGSRPDAAARQALHAQILQVLTPEQQAKFKANSEKMQREGGPFAPDPKPTPET